MSGAVILLTGRSFSGKSTLAAALAGHLGAAVLSYDAINAERGLHGGAGVAVEEWIRTGETAQRRAVVLLAAGATVVVDDTSSPRSLRDAWRTIADDCGAAFSLVFVDTPVDVVRQRLTENRETLARDDVYDAVMEEHLGAFEPPEPDEPHLQVTSGSRQEEVAARVRASLA